MNALYSLTAYTGRASNRDRTTVVGTVELKQRTFWVSLASLVPAAALTGLLFTIIGSAAILAIPVVVAAFLWLFNSRARHGLNLWRWQQLRDQYGKKSTEPLHTPMFCHQRLDTSRARIVRIVSSSQPLRPAGIVNAGPAREADGPGTAAEPDREDVSFEF